jgi:hypothetical protein
MASDRTVRPGIEESALGKLLHALGTGERFGVRAAGMPLLKSISPGAYQRLQDQDLGEVYGGDLYRALRPSAGKIEGTVGGIAVGGVLDPLSYVGLGGMTKVGKLAQVGEGLRTAGKSASALNEAGRLAMKSRPMGATFAEQARLGQRALLHTPMGNVGVTPFWQGLDLLQSGHMAERILNKTPHTEWMMTFGKAMDRATTRLAGIFNLPVGVPLPLWRSYKKMMSSMMGTTMQTTRRFAESMEPEIRDFAQSLSKQYDMPFDKAMQGLREVLTSTMEEFPELRLAKDAKRIVAVPGRTQYDVALEKFQEHFPLPFGPRSHLDHPNVARMKEIHYLMRNAYDDILHKEQQELNRTMVLMGKRHLYNEAMERIKPTNWGDYVLHMASQEGRAALEEGAEKVWRGSGIGPSISKRQPITSHASHIFRRMRLINPAALEESKDILSSYKFFRSAKSTRRSNLYTLLKKDLDGMQGGKLMSTRSLRMLNEMLEKDAIDPELVERLIPSMSVDQANTWIRTHGLGKLVQPGQVDNFFEADPTVLLSARGMRTDRAVLSNQFFQEITDPAKGLAVKAKNRDELPQWAKDWQIPEQPDMKRSGYYFHPDAARWLNRLEKMESDFNKDMSGFFGMYSKALNTWKAWTLAVFPSYMTRNFVGNMWNYYLGSEDPVDAANNISDAFRMMKGIAKNEKFTFKTQLGEVVNSRELWDKVDKLGGWGIGFISPDYSRSVKEVIDAHNRFSRYRLTRGWDPAVLLAREYRNTGLMKKVGGIGPLSPKETRKALLNLWSPNNAYVETGFRINSILDDYTRAAHIIQKVKQGFSVEDAVASAKKHFFDYHDLSPAEKNLFRNIFPFYSWSRKNIPFQLESIVTRPSRIARFGSAVYSFNGWDQPEEERYLNQWMKSQAPLRVRKNSKTGKYEYFVFKNWLPLADIHDIVDPIQWSLQSLNPFIKVPLETIFNINLFTRRKLDRLNSWTKGEREIVFGEKVPKKVAHLLKSLRPVNTMHQLIDNPQDLDMMSQLTRFMAGKMYTLDVDRSLQEFSYLTGQLAQDRGAALKAAQRRGLGTEEYGRINRVYLEQLKKLQEGFGVTKKPYEDRGMFDFLKGEGQVGSPYNLYED